MNHRKLAPFALCATLAACATPGGSMVGGLYYEGEVTRAQLSELELGTEDGRRARFAELFPGYAPQGGLVIDRLPFERLAINRITEKALRRLARRYDANANGWLEEPELTVLYVREAAAGLGHPLAQVGGERAIGALHLSHRDVGGLVHYVGTHAHRMSPDAAWLFTRLDWLGRDQRLEADGDGRADPQP